MAVREKCCIAGREGCGDGVVTLYGYIKPCLRRWQSFRMVGTTRLCGNNQSVSNVDDAGDLAQRGTVPQLSGRCLLAVDGMSGAEYEGGLRRAVKNGMQE